MTVRPFDIALAVDSSPSISTQNWNYILNYLRVFIQYVNKIDKISAAADGSRFGLVSYAAQPKVIFTFNTLQGSSLNAKEVLALVDKTTRQSGEPRRLDLALQAVKRDVFSVSGGSRPKSRRVSRWT